MTVEEPFDYVASSASGVLSRCDSSWWCNDHIVGRGTSANDLWLLVVVLWDYTKITEQISMERGWRMGLNPE